MGIAILIATGAAGLLYINKIDKQERLEQEAHYEETNDYMDRLSERLQEPPSMHDGGFK